ncbi:MAG: hypothetical protein KY444_04240 [Gemmatimonadetes bacterium]|nr:hypothetical protein [Gemmatimonadota bacterium]
MRTPIVTPHTAGTDALRARLTPLLAAEFATLAALDSLIAHEGDPAYVVLFRSAKVEKQANVAQVSTLLRGVGLVPPTGGGPAEALATIHTLLLQKVSTPALLNALRRAEEPLVAGYREAAGALDGLAAPALRRAGGRALKLFTLLTAHVARHGDREAEAALPLALSEYFATSEARVCVRCLVDRPGGRPPIARRAPCTYLCGACHHEVREDLPPDLRVQAERWPDEVREDRVVERALGRPQKLKAIGEVHAVLCGLPPEVILPPAPWKDPAPAPDTAPAPGEPLPVLDTAPGAATPSERAYSDLLFDFRGLREHW